MGQVDCKFEKGRLPTAGRQRAVLRTGSGTRLFCRVPLPVGYRRRTRHGGRVPTFDNQIPELANGLRWLGLPEFGGTFTPERNNAGASTGAADVSPRSLIGIIGIIVTVGTIRKSAKLFTAPPQIRRYPNKRVSFFAGFLSTDCRKTRRTPHKK
jgi:hypothetical protein